MREKGKIIAVWGSPESGKTTFSVKLAAAIYDAFDSTVIILHTDLETPVLPVLFPSEKTEDIGSVGAVLAKTEIDTEDVIKNLVTLKDRQNFGFIGYRAGENRFTYPKYGASKVKALLDVLTSISDYVIVDCISSPAYATLDNTCLESADILIRLATPDLKSISFYLSQLPLYTDTKYNPDKHIQGINIPSTDIIMPTEERKAGLSDVSFTLPYSAAVKEQMQKGTLFAATRDKKFEECIKKIAEKVVEDGED